ncbi:hypothetical protein K3555_18360 [Leisingera sp. M527]|uniref:hypothetical protein n=1 Tax=Leisingera sp. M527 TaxID=2867014 RepID=UPI0021A909DE|nr:hypothetical protein [Leisingera sp. M527]UWQ32467.1 hypothetical protein K3555_18360 [Leisingera sp. M527]
MAKIFIYLAAGFVSVSAMVWGQRAEAYSEILRELHAEGRLVLRDADYEFINRSLPPNFSVALNYKTDGDTGWLHFNLQGLPQPDLVNIYILPSEDLQRLGFQSGSVCKAIKQDELRYIFCDLGILRFASKEMVGLLGGAIEPTFFSRLVLGHEMAHHFYDHPTLAPDFSADTLQIRNWEREADNEAAIMLAEPAFRKAFLQSVFSDAEPPSDPGFLNRIWDFLNQPRTQHDDLSHRFESIAARSVQVFGNRAEFAGLVPVVPEIDPSHCGSPCAQSLAPATLQSVAFSWFRSSWEERQNLAAHVISRRGEITGTVRKDWDIYLMECQAQLLLDNSAKCAVAPVKVLEAMRDVAPLEHFFWVALAQTVLLKPDDEGRDWAVQFINGAGAAVDQRLWYAWYGDRDWSQTPGHPVYSYLAFLGGEGMFVDCGANHMGLHTEPSFNCVEYAEQVRRTMGQWSISGIHSLNIAMSEDLRDPFSHEKVLKIAAISLTSEFEGTILPAWFALLRSLSARQDIADRFNADLIAGFLFGELQTIKPVREHLLAVAENPALEQLPRPERIQLLFEILFECERDYDTQCALPIVEQLLDLIVEVENASSDHGDEWVTNRRQIAEFKLARILILRNEAGQAIEILERQASETSEAKALIGIWETLAEAHIQLCDGAAAAAAMVEAEKAIADHGVPRTNNERINTLSYNNSAAFLLGNKDRVRELIGEIDELTLQTFAFTYSGAEARVAKCGGFEPLSSMLAWAEN